MHDMDRTRAEFEAGIDALESGYEMNGEGGFGQEMPNEYGFGQGEGGQGQGEYGFGQGEYGFGQGEAGTTQGESVFAEQQEMELASQLLEVTNEQELEQFLGNLIRGAGRAIGGIVRGPVGQALGGVLKQAAKVALPMAGTALGNLVAPGIGGVVGGKLASAAGKAFGLELEGLSGEDREFEVARRYVRLAGAATQNAVAAPEGTSPQQVAQSALMQAARVHAPGLAQQLNGRSAASNGARGASAQGGQNRQSGQNGRQQSGRWIRRGRRIILTGV
jgi:hypothetical protein